MGAWVVVLPRNVQLCCVASIWEMLPAACMGVDLMLSGWLAGYECMQHTCPVGLWVTGQLPG